MNFNTTQLGKLTGKELLGIREMKTSPLILIKANGTVEFASRPKEKDLLIDKFNESEDVLLFAWAGQWRTDVFVVTSDDLRRCYT